MGAHLTRAQLLLGQGRLDLAEQELRQALVEEPNAAFPHALLAICLARMERFDEATQEARAAIHAEPDFAFAHYAHGSILHDRHRLDEASAAAAEAIRLDPENADYHALVGAIRLEERRWTEALASAERGLEFDAEHVGCNNIRAASLVKLGRRSEAGATLEAALARDPEDAMTHANQGWALLHQAEPKKAMEHFREALRLEPDNQWARAGIVESLKARNPIYGIMLRYFLFMARLSGKAQWAIILGGYFGQRFLRSMAASNPQLAPWVMPIVWAYVAFAVMTWISYPLFNLFLRFHPYGKYALTDEQKTASNWVGACIAVTLGFAVAWLAFKVPFAGFGAIAFGVLLLPLSAVFNCHAGWPRRLMACYTAILALAAVLLVGEDIVGIPLPQRLAGTLTWVFGLGCFLSGWVANGLMQVVPRR